MHWTINLEDRIPYLSMTFILLSRYYSRMSIESFLTKYIKEVGPSHPIA